MNKESLLVILCLVIIATAFLSVLTIALFLDSFVAGFYAATITWNWHNWLYQPLDRFLNKYFNH